MDRWAFTQEPQPIYLFNNLITPFHPSPSPLFSLGDGRDLALLLDALQSTNWTSDETRPREERYASKLCKLGLATAFTSNAVVDPVLPLRLLVN